MARPLTLLALLTATLSAQTPDHQLARDILRELIETNTTPSAGDCTAAAQLVAKRLRAAGFPEADVQVVVPAPKQGNLIARLRGRGTARPIVFLAHLDVVEARRDDWSVDPFRLLERDGYFYGRGTQDIKGDAALLVANFIRLKREGFTPDRDLILALTAGEEGGAEPNGVDWLLKNRRDLIDAEFCVNVDAGGPQARDGRLASYTMQAAEKTFLSLSMTARNPGGHSSQPRADNAIYDLAEALLKLRAHQFPVMLNDVTRAWFSATGETQDAADPYRNALLRTTCVATMLDAGHASNALPQKAQATVNCRVLPGHTQAEVEAALRQAAGNKVEWAVQWPMANSPASPLPPSLVQRVESIVAAQWPGLRVVPTMETGATDGALMRRAGIPTYGLALIAVDLEDNRMHGKDERIRIRYFNEGLDFGYRLIRAVAAAPAQ
ncbi:MAG: M20/M25/M40 family metallo-hydrolase [Acidobacteria bacterium]|nr:M20/M25/M40 family metallo-hydrolase [Acidobacteriota bacterium]